MKDIYIIKNGNDENNQSITIFSKPNTVEQIIIPSGTTITDGYEITLSNKYYYNNNSLEIYWNGIKLIKATDTSDGHYKEIKNATSLSNCSKIQICRTSEDGSYTLTEDVIVTAITRNINW